MKPISHIALEPIPVVIAFTANYLTPAATFISSLLACSNTNDRFDIICLLADELTDGMMEQLHLLGGERAKFSFVASSGLLEGIYVDPVFTEAASYRLLLPNLLPTYDKILYMDCDIIVRNNMADLYRSLDLGKNYLAAVYEATLHFQESYVKTLGCNLGCYFNSGVLIMNLSQMRADNMTSIFIEASRQRDLHFPDQDVLNKYCKGRTIGLAPHYNAIRTFLLPQYKADFLKYYSEHDWQLVQSQGNIHYTGGKPWNSFTVKFEQWWRYYEQLPRGIKLHGEVNIKLYILYKLCCNTIGRMLVSGVQSLYRKFKYKAML